MPKPRYHNLTGFEPSPPPFTFYGVTSRVFPLRASPRRLQSFCDRYLNHAPEISYCQPLAPVVLLCILNYGRMGGDSAGWIAQNEVLFTLLLEWWHRDENGEEKTELATVTPFLFVDDPLSQTTGREVYGWPKIKAWFEPDIASWGSDVVTRPRPIRMSSLVFPHAYEGQRPQRRTLLEIDPEPLSGLTDLPPDFRFLSDAVWCARRGIEETFRSMRDWGEMLLMRGGPPNLLSLLPPIPLPGLPPGLTGAGGNLDGRPSEANQRVDLAYQTLTLKQFPDPSSSREACYQALVSTDMEITRYKGWGLLGEPTLLRGDTTGGFIIRLHRFPEFPIVDALGLDVERWENVEDSSDDQGARGVTRGAKGSTVLSPFEGRLAHEESRSHSVAVIRPMIPYWLDSDLVYGKGRTVCWRTTHTDWSCSEEPGPPTREPLPYNTANGDVFIPLQGPFRFPGATLRLLAFEIDRGQDEEGEGSEEGGTFPAQELIDDYLNAVQSKVQLEVVGEHVFLVAASFESTESKGNDIGWWADREVGFWIPLKKAGEDESAEAFQYYMTSPFLFGSSHFAALTLRETFGLPILRAHLDSPPDVWMSDSGPTADRTRLRVSTPIFPAVTSDQQARTRTLLEIVETPRRDDEAIEEDDLPTERWKELYEGLDFGDGKKAEIWVRSIFLRRFRDAGEPDRACFQALLEGSLGLSKIRTHLLDKDRFEMRIHHHPSHPLVDKLGLKVDHQERRPSDWPGRAWEGRPVDVLRPRFVAWMTADLQTGLSDAETHLYPPRRSEHGHPPSESGES